MTYGSIAPSTRKSYDSIWKTWTLFMQICHHNPSEDQINCTDITQQQLLKLLLMLLTSIPGILSGLKNNLVLRFVPLEAFDNSLLVAMKASVKSVEFKCFNSGTLVPSSSMHSICWASVEIVRFTIQHRLSTTRLLMIPHEHTTPQRPFPLLSSYPPLPRVPHSSRRHCATVFGLHPQWSNPIRMAASTVLRASGGDDDDILYLGRWKCRKQVPTSLIFQGTSTKNNNKVLCLAQLCSLLQISI
jgi:hypothetical protein